MYQLSTPCFSSKRKAAGGLWRGGEALRVLPPVLTQWRPTRANSKPTIPARGPYAFQRTLPCQSRWCGSWSRLGSRSRPPLDDEAICRTVSVVAPGKTRRTHWVEPAQSGGFRHSAGASSRCVHADHFPSAGMACGHRGSTTGGISDFVRLQITLGLVDHSYHGRQLPHSDSIHLRLLVASRPIGYLAACPYWGRLHCLRLHREEAVLCVPRSGAFIALLKSGEETADARLCPPGAHSPLDSTVPAPRTRASRPSLLTATFLLAIRGDSPYPENSSGGN